MKSILVSCCLFVLHYTFYGQTLTGAVHNEEEQVLSNVHISNISNDLHTHTNEQGFFSLKNISPGDSLQFSHVGYFTLFLVVEDLTSPLNIVLIRKSLTLEKVVISPKVNAIHLITDIDIETNPVNSSQDVLRKVPGLFIGQHAGGGKAEQIFLRGFDIDHGTDINITVDGLPVNMVSHAHGQGYADLHFVIPETIDKIDFGKGPYYLNKGNFNTAGYVDFLTRQRLDNSLIKAEVGQFDTYRLLGMFNILENNSQNAYIATEYIATNGPFDSPQNFNRINLLGKYNGIPGDDQRFRITLSHFQSIWDASGQIPQRAVDNQTIGRFGAIDDTEGGNTSRTNLLINYDKFINKNSTLKNTVYISQYDFELYSNFTFFLEFPTDGDQIKQKEDRIIYGLNSEFQKDFSSGNITGSWHAGINLRNDQSDNNELSHTKNRSETLNHIQLGDIKETNIGASVGSTLDINKWTFNPSVRTDFFDYQYNNHLLLSYRTQSLTKTIISPKLNIIYNPSHNLQLYLKTGKGFHSNDTRVILSQKNKKILPAAYGADAGFLWKPTTNIVLNMAYWYLFSEQEFVYVGDAGIVEPSGKASRHGVDVSLRYQPIDWLFWNLDANYTVARATEEIPGQDYIPLAPGFSLVSSFNILHKSGIHTSANLRYLADRPANEDNSIIANGYFITDLNIGYNWNKFGLGLQVQNLFNSQWNETQFATLSRLEGEIDPVEEIHFTPGTPFFMKAIIEYRF